MEVARLLLEAGARKDIVPGTLYLATALKKRGFYLLTLFTLLGGGGVRVLPTNWRVGGRDTGY